MDTSIFRERRSSGYRMLIAAAFCICLMAADRFVPQVDYLRQLLSVAIAPVRWVVNLPVEMASWGSETFSTRSNLIEENASLRAQLFVLERKSQQLIALETENQRLRQLLNASRRVEHKLVMAELTSVDPDPFTHQVIINRGISDGVFIGQAVLDAKGLMGQVVQVEQFSARVLLIADSNHATPLQVNRNGVRSIGVGSGSLDKIKLIYVPDTADIVEGDLLITSGLGGRFPAGYPVAEVFKVEHDPAEPFAVVEAKPTAELNRSRHVMLVFPQEGR